MHSPSSGRIWVQLIHHEGWLPFCGVFVGNSIQLTPYSIRANGRKVAHGIIPRKLKDLRRIKLEFLPNTSTVHQVNCKDD